MDKQAALNALGLSEGASAEAIGAALAAKRQDLAGKKASAPTDALKAKFAAIESKLAEVEKALTEAPGGASPAGDQARQGAAGSLPNPAPSRPSLSQTKLADLPGLAPQDAAQVELQPGQTLGNRYEIKELIGQGGMGAVYRAFDKNRDEDIAIKVLLPSLTKNERALQRFLNEARISSKLSHPNIVNVFDVQSDGALYFLTMELLEGQDLRQVMENQKAAGRPFDIEDVKEYIAAISAGLAYAHQHTVHRDIKPENIWITDDQQIKLMDFGIAQLQSTSQRTQTGAAMGTAYYMAPEQLKGVKDIDGRADQYALAVLAYELLTGEVPAGVIEPVNALRKDLPKGMANAIMQAMNARPENRFADIRAFDQAIQSGKGAKKARTPQASARSTAAHFSQGPNKWAMAAVLLLLVGVGGAVGTGVIDLSGLLPMSAEEKAQKEAAVAKLQGEIKVLKQRLETGRRNLDSDVRDAERNKSSNLNALQHWQTLTENSIFNGSQLGELEGTQSMAETLLRKEQYAPSEQAFIEVKAGYEKLNAEFQAGEKLHEADQSAQKAKSEWLAFAKKYSFTGQSPSAEQAQQTYDEAQQQSRSGELAAALTLFTTSATGWNRDREIVRKLAEHRDAAQSAKRAWQAFAKQYSFTGQSPSAEQAQQTYDEAQQQSRSGELATSLSLFQQAQQQWQSAPRDEAVVAQVGKQEAAWAAEAERQRQAAAAAAEAERRALIARAVGKLVQIPAGSFKMGGKRYSDEKPIHSVSVKSFSMQEHEVTFAQWDACVSAGGCSHKPGDQGWGRGNRPVMRVSWNDITQQFIPWLNKATGQKFRLPTEAEWEYAARAGSTTEYSWGDSIGSNRANCDGCGSQWDKQKTAPVKSFSPNQWGLYDMHGNVWEWVQDCRNDSYSGAPTNGSAWQSGDCSKRVLRGGSWNNAPDNLRSAYRDWSAASIRDLHIGFRLVQDR